MRSIDNTRNHSVEPLQQQQQQQQRINLSNQNQISVQPRLGMTSIPILTPSSNLIFQQNIPINNNNANIISNLANNSTTTSSTTNASSNAVSNSVSIYNNLLNAAANNQNSNLNFSRNNNNLNIAANSGNLNSSNINNIVNNLIYSRLHINSSVLSPMSVASNTIANTNSHHSRSGHHYHNRSGGSSNTGGSSGNLNNNISLHSSFKSKSVCQLTCRYCQGILCRRGMKAILLADTRVELYSTDTVPIGVQLVANDYVTRNCLCQIRDVACLGCGNVVGYHVTQPCDVCMSACNNGHFWMFHHDAVKAKERMDSTGLKPLLWAHLPYHEKETNIYDDYELICR